MNEIDVTKLPLYNPLETFHKEHNNTNKEVCPICTDDLDLTTTEKIKDLAITKCAHVFHKECLPDWLNRQDTCPNCRMAGIQQSITQSSTDGHLIFNHLLNKQNEPKNDRKRKIDDVESEKENEKVSNAEIVKFLMDNNLLKSEGVSLNRPDTENFLSTQPNFAFVIRWSSAHQEVLVTQRIRRDYWDVPKKDIGKWLKKENLVVPKRYIDAYKKAHPPRKKSKNDEAGSKFDILKFHMDIPREFALTLNQDKVEKVVANYPLNTKIFYLDPTTYQPMIAVQKNGTRSFTACDLADELGDLTLREYLEGNIIVIPKQYRDDYNGAQFHVQRQQVEPQVKSDEEYAKELEKFYAGIDSGYESDEKLAKEMEQTGLTPQQMAQIQEDEKLARVIARQQK